MSKTRQKPGHVLLTPNETLEVERLAKRFSAQARRDRSLNSLIQDWMNFAREALNGYSLGPDDYTNDLTARDSLLELMQVGSPGLAAKIASAVSLADDDYRRGTVEIGTPLRPATPDRWWWYRVPNRVDGDRGEYLRAWGINE